MLEEAGTHFKTGIYQSKKSIITSSRETARDLETIRGPFQFCQANQVTANSSMYEVQQQKNSCPKKRVTQNHGT